MGDELSEGVAGALLGVGDEVDVVGEVEAVEVELKPVVALLSEVVSGAGDGALTLGEGAEDGRSGVALLEDGEQVGEVVQLDDCGGEVLGLVCGLDLGDEAVGLYLKDLGQVARAASGLNQGDLVC